MFGNYWIEESCGWFFVCSNTGIVDGFWEEDDAAAYALHLSRHA
jgi:hypothetical protein